MGRVCAMNRVKPVLLDEQQFALMNALNRKHPRYKLLWLLGTCTGLRVSDVLRLSVSEARQHVWSVTEKKTGKVRVIDFPVDLRDEIDRYVERFHLKPNDYLIFSRSTRHDIPIGRQHAHYVISRAAASVGLDTIGTHSMRKTFAVDQYRRTHDLEALRSILNHTYVSTTLTYLVVTEGNKTSLVV